MTSRRTLRNRLLGFTLLPALAAISPLAVLPVIARVAGPAGWSSAIAGESLGTFAAIAIAYGWGTIGPALTASAVSDEQRGLLYRESIVVRMLISAAVLPLLILTCWFVSSPGFELLTILMGVQGALIALTFTWFAAGVGDPWAIATYDAVPRLIAAVAAAAVITLSGNLIVYPLAGIAVTIGGTGLYTLRLLERLPARWPPRREIGRLFRSGAPIAVNDAALGAYSSVPTPLVNVTSPSVGAAGFASADKLLKLGQFLPLTLANALQSWITEVHGPARSRRMRRAVGAHAIFGIAGFVILAFAGPPVSRLLFGDRAVAPFGISLAFGVAFALYSVRTSMTRHLLFPTDQSRIVVRATLAGTVVGVPLMVILALTAGPSGVAVGFAATEAVATLLLVAPCARALRRLDNTAASEP